MSLLQLPNELLCHIAECLQFERDIAALAKTNSRLYNLTISQLYRFNAKCSESTALIWAVAHGSVATATKALKEIVSSSDDEDKTETVSSSDDEDKMETIIECAMVLATGTNQKEIISLLVQSGACLHSYDWDRMRNAMEAAAEQGHADVVKLLLNFGASPSAGLGNHPFAIQLAATGGHVDIVRLLIEAGENPDRCSGRPAGGSFSPLQAAALYDNVDLAALLLAKGARVNHRSASGDTPLELAVRKNSVQCLKLLLEAGAKVYGKDHRHVRHPALEWAKRLGHEQCLELLKNENVHVYLSEEDARFTKY